MKSGCFQAARVVAFFAGVLLAQTICAKNLPESTIGNICQIGEHPDDHAGKRVTIRGSIKRSMESTTITDWSCPRYGFEVKFVRNVKNSAAIDDLIRKISRWKLQGYATVSGIFTVSRGPLDSYTIHVDEVRDVTPGRAAPNSEQR